MLGEVSAKVDEAAILELMKRLSQSSFTGKIVMANIIPVCFADASNKCQQILIT